MVCWGSGASKGVPSTPLFCLGRATYLSQFPNQMPFYFFGLISNQMLFFFGRKIKCWVWWILLSFASFGASAPFKREGFEHPILQTTQKNKKGDIIWRLSPPLCYGCWLVVNVSNTKHNSCAFLAVSIWKHNSVKEIHCDYLFAEEASRRKQAKKWLWYQLNHWSAKARKKIWDAAVGHPKWQALLKTRIG